MRLFRDRESHFAIVRENLLTLCCIGYQGAGSGQESDGTQWRSGSRPTSEAGYIHSRQNSDLTPAQPVPTQHTKTDYSPGEETGAALSETSPETTVLNSSKPEPVAQQLFDSGSPVGTEKGAGGDQEESHKLR